MPARKKISDGIVYTLHEFGVLIESREIFLTSSLEENTEDALIDHRSATHFIKNLQLLNSLNTDPILVHQITCGGYWAYGIAIYDAIKASCDNPNASDVIVLSHAHARSMSSIIPQAATSRVIMPNADFLIHWGTDCIDGNYTSVQAEADWSKKTAARMLDIYVEVCSSGNYWKKRKMSPARVKSWLKDKMDKKQEFYMIPQQAVDMGFMDGILGDPGFENIESLRN